MNMKTKLNRLADYIEARPAWGIAIASVMGLIGGVMLGIA